MAARLGIRMDYADITASIRALTHGETDTVALMATVVCEIHNAHPFAATASRSLDDDRQTYFFRNGHGLFNSLYSAVAAWNCRHTGLDHQGLC